MAAAEADKRRVALEARIAAYQEEVRGRDVFSMVARGMLSGGGDEGVPARAVQDVQDKAEASAGAASGDIGSTSAPRKRR